MRKFKVITVFFILLSCGAFLSMSPRKHFLFLVNNRNESIFIRCQASPELQVIIEGKIYYTLKYNNEEIGYLFAGGVGYDYIYEIKPNNGIECYCILSPMRWETGPKAQFLNLTPLEQLKAIYTDISVTDKDGNEILNLEMIKPEDFIMKGRLNEFKSLIIK
jgi:hypothetical protein